MTLVTTIYFLAVATFIPHNYAFITHSCNFVSHNVTLLLVIIILFLKIFPLSHCEYFSWLWVMYFIITSLYLTAVTLFLIIVTFFNLIITTLYLSGATVSYNVTLYLIIWLYAYNCSFISHIISHYFDYTCLETNFVAACVIEYFFFII